MARSAVSIRFNLPQWRAYHAIEPHRTVFYGWGRGVGKSWFTRQAWWLLVSKWEHRLRPEAPEPLRGVRITVLMPTLKQFKQVHWAGIERELGKGGPWAHLCARLDRQEATIQFPGGSRITPFPASAYDAQHARGMRCDVLSCDEFDDIDASVYDAIAVPWLSEPWSLGIELLGGTPTRGRHGLWFRTLQAGRLGAKIRASELSDDELVKRPEVAAIASRFDADTEPGVILDALRSTYSFHATYKDTPETVSGRAVARARAKSPPAAFKREWEADPDSGEGQVYAFSEDFHVRVPPSSLYWDEFWVGGDHGWNDPGVLLLCGLAGRGNDATLWILDEVYQTETPNHVWDAKAAAWTKRYGHEMRRPPPVFALDRSRPDRIRDFINAGVNARGADNDIEAGVARIADLLAIRHYEGKEPAARLYVHPRCVNTIREFGEYRRKKDPRDSERFLEAIEDRNNHAMDAVRYVALERFGRPQTGRFLVPAA